MIFIKCDKIFIKINAFNCITIFALFCYLKYHHNWSGKFIVSMCGKGFRTFYIKKTKPSSKDRYHFSMFPPDVFTTIHIWGKYFSNREIWRFFSLQNEVVWRESERSLIIFVMHDFKDKQREKSSSRAAIDKGDHPNDIKPYYTCATIWSPRCRSILKACFYGNPIEEESCPKI